MPELPCPVRRLLEELGMYTFPLVALAAVCVLALVVLNRRLLAVTASNRINADRITRDFVGVVAACAALGVVLQLLVDLHHLE